MRHECVLRQAWLSYRL